MLCLLWPFSSTRGRGRAYWLSKSTWWQGAGRALFEREGKDACIRKPCRQRFWGGQKEGKKCFLSSSTLWRRRGDITFPLAFWRSLPSPAAGEAPEAFSFTTLLLKGMESLLLSGSHCLDKERNAFSSHCAFVALSRFQQGSVRQMCSFVGWWGVGGIGLGLYCTFRITIALTKLAGHMYVQTGTLHLFIYPPPLFHLYRAGPQCGMKLRFKAI